VTLVYATSGDLAAWTGTTAPANATSLLRSASLLVRDATASAFYAADTTGLPTDTATLQAFNDATCAQAAYWAANGIDPAAGALPTAGVLRGKKIGSASLDYDTAAAVNPAVLAARMDSVENLVPEAARILRAAGVNTYGPWIVG
jgi:hypothetical protein